MEELSKNEAGVEIEDQDGKAIADRLKSFGDESGFDQQTCDEIAEMPFFDAFETAYSYLTQAGLDADEVLAEFMQEPQE